MKKILFFLLAAVLFTAVFGCSSVNQTNCQKTAEKIEKRLKVGLYVDKGASGNGVFHLASLIAHSPQTELVTLMAEDIRSGALKDINILVMPGGSSKKQCETIGKEHLEKIREFLRNGGGFVGTCAGMFDTLEHLMQLLPFARHIKAGGSTAYATIEISREGAEILGLSSAGPRVVRYSGGPAAYALKNSKSEGKGKTLAVFKSAVSRDKAHEGKFIGSSALIYGSYGKGKVAATSFHPEYWESTHDIMLGCFYAVSGVKMTPNFPQKNYRPIRVGILSIGATGKAPIATMLKLEKEPDIDLDYVMSAELNQGILSHLDVLVIPSADLKKTKKYLSQKQLKKFMDNGGVVIAADKSSMLAPPHKNFKQLSPNADILKYIFKK